MTWTRGWAQLSQARGARQGLGPSVLLHTTRGLRVSSSVWSTTTTVSAGCEKLPSKPVFWSLQKWYVVRVSGVMKSERKIVWENKTTQPSTSSSSTAEPRADTLSSQRWRTAWALSLSLGCGWLAFNALLWRRIFISPSVCKGYSATGTLFSLLFLGCFWSPWKRLMHADCNSKHQNWIPACSRFLEEHFFRRWLHRKSGDISWLN